MIDWISLLFHIVWILGAAVILAAFSYHHWQANQQQQPLRQHLRQPAFIRPFALGATLISLGLAGTSPTTWEAIIWGIIFFIVLIYSLRQWLPSRSHQEHGN